MKKPALRRALQECFLKKQLTKEIKKRCQSAYKFNNFNHVSKNRFQSFLVRLPEHSQNRKDIYVTDI